MNKLLDKLGCSTVALIIGGLIVYALYRTANPPPAVLSQLRGVDKIVMHETFKYSFLVEGRFHTYSTNNANGVELKSDVPEKEKDWVEIYTQDVFIDGPKTTYMIIHIHNPNDITAGGWNHGKFGQGMNTVIE
jgi:hypothetical protein